ncbi:hypothetical protein C2S51_007012 [Perilla frutescens var. frutescens]|nr:hypothetical protein C2S51_007012 [Perilla frutescens var. frutescens]
MIHALMTYEVHMSDRERVGREAWFHIHHSQLRFGPSEYNLVSSLRSGGLTFDPNDDHIVPSRSMYHRLFEGKRTTVRQMEDRSEPSHGSMGVGASGGCGAMELISIGCIFLPDADALHQPPLQDSTGYGWEMIRAIWACEVIPELARETGVHSEQPIVPRCLRWTFIRPVTDPATLLQGNKKKMLANTASCCSSSAEEVVPPSARGTRAARTPQKSRQMTSRPSSWALRDEPDLDYIPGLRPSTEETAEHTVDPIHRESPSRAWGRKRACGPGYDAPCLGGLFDELEDPIAEIREMMLRYFLIVTSRRVKRDPKYRTVLAATGLYALVGEWKRLHPLDPDCLQTYENDEYRQWKLPSGLIQRITGKAIMVCNISQQHWVVVRVRLTD